MSSVFKKCENNVLQMSGNLHHISLATRPRQHQVDHNEAPSHRGQHQVVEKSEMEI